MDGTLIFLDIDGTLVAPGKNEPPASALEAIRGTQAAGHRVFLCTGRNRRMLEPLLACGFDGFIASSGGYVVCGEEVLFDRPMTDAQREKAMAVFESAGVARIAESRDCAFEDARYLDYLKEKLPGKASSETARWQAQLERDMGLYPMAAYRGEPLYKIVLLSDTARALEAAHAALEEDFALVVQGADACGAVTAELVPRAFDKGRGIRRICEKLGVPPERCFGYGDSMNDRELLETVGHGAAMRNAPEALKALADEICPGVEEDGLLVSFRRNGLFKTI